MANQSAWGWPSSDPWSVGSATPGKQEGVVGADNPWSAGGPQDDGESAITLNMGPGLLLLPSTSGDATGTPSSLFGSNGAQNSLILGPRSDSRNEDVSIGAQQAPTPSVNYFGGASLFGTLPLEIDNKGDNNAPTAETLADWVAEVLVMLGGSATGANLGGTLATQNPAYYRHIKVHHGGLTSLVTAFPSIFNISNDPPTNHIALVTLTRQPPVLAAASASAAAVSVASAALAANEPEIHPDTPKPSRRRRQIPQQPVPVGRAQSTASDTQVADVAFEVLCRAPDHSLKAVELANTLRAKLGTEALASVRKSYGGLLALLERFPAFAVVRIPKRDHVSLKPQYIPSAASLAEYEPPPVELATRCLHVASIGPDTTTDDLLRRFEPFGEVESVRVVTQKERRFAFVSFATTESAQAAIAGADASLVAYAHRETARPRTDLDPNAMAWKPHEQAMLTVAGVTNNTSGTLTLCNVSGSVSAAHLQEVCGQYGAVTTCALDSITQSAVIHFVEPSCARAACAALNGTQFGGSTLSAFVGDRPSLAIPESTLTPPPMPSPPTSCWFSSAPRGAPTPTAGGAVAANGTASDVRIASARNLDSVWGQPTTAMHISGVSAVATAPLTAVPNPFVHQPAVVPSPGFLPANVAPNGLGVPHVPAEVPPVDSVSMLLTSNAFNTVRLWPVDPTRDQPVVAAITALLVELGGRASVTRLRAELRDRLHTAKTVKSVPLKALLAAYADRFSVHGSQVVLLPNNSSS